MGLGLCLWICGLVVFMVYGTCFMGLGLRVEIGLWDRVSGFVGWIIEFAFTYL
jgi:hypothetical protein